MKDWKPAGRPSPTPQEIRDARKIRSLTQQQAAALSYATQRAWQNWELGKRRMHPGLFELFEIKLKYFIGRRHNVPNLCIELVERKP